MSVDEIIRPLFKYGKKKKKLNRAEGPPLLLVVINPINEHRWGRDV